MIKKYRKKPVVIEAVEYDGTECSVVEAVTFIKNEKNYAGLRVDCGDLIIPTLEGAMRASEGDYIIKGIKGEFYPCKPDIFRATYEEIE